jgi:hypothetical protein
MTECKIIDYNKFKYKHILRMYKIKWIIDGGFKSDKECSEIFTSLCKKYKN